MKWWSLHVTIRMQQLDRDPVVFKEEDSPKEHKSIH